VRFARRARHFFRTKRERQIAGTGSLRIGAPDYRTALRNQHDQLNDLGLYSDMRFETFDISTILSEKKHIIRKSGILEYYEAEESLDDIGGQTVVFFVLVVAAAEVVVGLGIIVSILRRKPGATADDVAMLKG
jgi:NADH:ubiquinone oxidoreductase subunit K